MAKSTSSGIWNAGAVSPSCHTTRQVSLATGRIHTSAEPLKVIIAKPTTSHAGQESYRPISAILLKRPPLADPQLGIRPGLQNNRAWHGHIDLSTW